MADNCHLCSLILEKEWSKVMALISQSDHLLHQEGNQSDYLLHQEENQSDHLLHQDGNQSDHLLDQEGNQLDHLLHQDGNQSDHLLHQERNQSDHLLHQERNQSDHLLHQNENQSNSLLDQDGMAVVNVVKVYMNYLQNEFDSLDTEQKMMSSLWKTPEIFESEVRQNVLNVLKSLLTSKIYQHLQSVVDESLLAAVRTHDEELVSMFLRSGSNLNKIHPREKINSFGLSIILDNLEMVQLLFNYGAKVNEDCGSGQTPLGLCMYKNIEICKFLLQHGADKVQISDVGSNPVELFCFPIFSAVYARNTFLVRALLENGANVNESFKDSRENPFHLVLKHGTVPLHLAVQQTDIEMVKTLIKYGARLDEVSGRGQTPLGMAVLADNPDSDKIVDILLTSGCSRLKESILIFFQRTYMPIFIACFSGKIDIVKRFLEEQSSPASMLNATASDGSTPLFMAAHGNHLQLVKYLLSLGADPYFSCYHGNLVHAAVHSGNVEMLTLVLNLGCEVDCLSGGGNTPLMLAVVGVNYLACELLVKREALLNAEDRFGYTSLLRCAMDDQDEIFRLLIQHGADCNVVDSNGQNPLCWSIVNKNERMIRLLLLSGATTWSEEEEDEVTALLQGKIVRPKPLLHVCMLVVRVQIAMAAGGRSIEKRVMSLPVGEKLKELLLLK